MRNAKLENHLNKDLIKMQNSDIKTVLIIATIGLL